MNTTAEYIAYDILPALKEHGMPSGFTNQNAFDELVRQLESAPTYVDRVRVNDDLVAMQRGEVVGSTTELQQLAASMSLLLGFSTGAYFAELNKLEMPKES